jgi:hypothetical protein
LPSPNDPLWPVSAAPTHCLRVRYWTASRRAYVEVARQFMTDTVEKGKNEPIKIFACARVETGFS